MPRKTYRRRKPKRRTRRRRTTMVIRKSPMPLKFATKLRYCENFTINPGAAGICGVNVFNAGSLYDPNVTGVGHQPRGFDQLIAMFDHFVVIGSKITLTVASRVGSAVPVICGVSLRDGSTTDTDPNDYQEGGTVRTRVLSPNATGNDVRSLRLTYSPKKFLGRSKPLSDPDLKGTVSADPLESAFYHCWIAPIQAVDATLFDCTVTIDYLAVFIEPKDVAQS